MGTCGICGYQLHENAKFCSDCGTSLEIVPAAPPPAPLQYYVPPAYEPPYQPQGYPPQGYSQPHYAPPYQQSSYPGQAYGQRNPAQQYYAPPSPQNWRQHPGASHGFAQTFGLHPAAMVLTLAVNTMVFVVGWGTIGIGWLTSIPVGLILGGIVYQIQRKWYEDDHESALLKALIVAFLTAIPTSLPGYLTIPSGILGFFRRKN